MTPPLLLAALNFLTPARTVRYSTHRGYCSQPTAVLLRVLFSLCFLPLLLLPPPPPPLLLPGVAAAIGDLIVIAAPSAAVRRSDSLVILFMLIAV